jgi:hypothetical protein
VLSFDLLLSGSSSIIHSFDFTQRGLALMLLLFIIFGAYVFLFSSSGVSWLWRGFEEDLRSGGGVEENMEKDMEDDKEVQRHHK